MSIVAAAARTDHGGPDRVPDALRRLTGRVGAHQTEQR